MAGTYRAPTTMSVTRRAVLEQLALASDADTRQTTTVDALAAELEVDERTIVAHLDGLADCELARIRPDGRVRVTTTGEEFVQLQTDGPVIVVPSTMDPDE